MEKIGFLGFSNRTNAIADEKIITIRNLNFFNHEQFFLNFFPDHFSTMYVTGRGTKPFQSVNVSRDRVI